MTLALRDAAEKQGYRYHTGVIQSKDSFYGELRPHQQAVADELLTKWKAWKAGGALTSEMETAALFVVGATLGVRCGAVLNVLWNADNDAADTSAPDAAARGVVTRYHTGVIQSKDSFYGELRPHQQAVADELLTKWKAWKAGGALTSEMETAALFVVGATLGVRCGAVLNVLWNADNDAADTVAPDAAARGVVTAVEALRLLIARDKI